MPTLYKIANWDTLYENSETRKLKALKWVPVPNKHDGLGFKRIFKRKDAGDIFTAWILILQVASKCPVRGQLSQDSPGLLPLLPGDLGDKTGFSGEAFKKALEFLSSKEIGWIVAISCENQQSPGVPVTPPETSGDAPETSGLNGMEGKEWKGREGNDVIPIYPGFEFVRITEPEYQKLLDKLGSDGRVKAAMEILENAIGAKGYKYKSHYRAILSWVVGELEERENKNKPRTLTPGRI